MILKSSGNIGEISLWNGNGYNIHVEKRNIQHEVTLGSDLVDSYSEEELLANTLYIFLLLVVFSIILGGILFGAREYSLSKPATPQENELHDTDKSGSSEDRGTKVNQQVQPTLKNPIDITLEHDDTVNSGSISPSLPIIYESNRKATLKGYADRGSPMSKIDVIQSESTSNEFTKGSLSKYLNIQFDSSPPPGTKLSKIVYSFSQILELRNVKQTQLSGDCKESRIYNIIYQPSFIPSTHFESAYFADRQINENALILFEDTNSEVQGGQPLQIDSFRKIMCALSVVSIGYALPDNPSFFLSSFNELITSMVDTGSIFNLVEEILSASLQEELISMVLVYFWSQWLFKSSPQKQSESIRAKVEAKLNDWKVMEPDLVGLHTIVRALINLEFGFHGLRRVNVIQKHLFIEKNRGLLTYICSDTRCNDYLGLLPLISQAISLTKNSEDLLIFYDLVSELVSQHGKCCMLVYIRDSKTGLKELVQHGLWNQQHYTVCDRAYSIYHTLRDQGYKEVEKWMEEIKRGRIYVPSSVVEFEKQHHISREAKLENKKDMKVATPGSWNFEELELNDEEKKELENEYHEAREHQKRRSPSLRRFAYQSQNNETFERCT